MVARRNFPKRDIFEEKTQKMLLICLSTGAKSGWPSSCNAFAIARFLVSFFFSSTLFSAVAQRTPIKSIRDVVVGKATIRDPEIGGDRRS